VSKSGAGENKKERTKSKKPQAPVFDAVELIDS
jgi:hypothetical protein